MNELQVFENEEFGTIRMIMIDNEAWFVGKDVAEALGFVNPRDAIATHVFLEDKGVEIIDTLGGKQTMAIINESGLYALVFGSRLESAKRFKHWVTSEVLPSIRKTGSYQFKKLSKEMQAILMHDEKIVEIDSRVKDLEDNMTIDYGQQQALGDAVNRTVLSVLGAKNSPAYKEIGKKVFAECNRDLKHYFDVNARNNVPKKRYDQAMDYARNWKPCTNTQILIQNCNTQIGI